MMAKKKTTKPKLTAKQEKFCDEYMIDLNATQAAIRSGYSKKTAEQGAAQLLSNIKVSKRVGELKEKIRKATGITIESVVEMIADTHKRAKEDGEEMSVELKAAELLGKHVGAFEKDNTQGQIQVVINN